MGGRKLVKENGVRVNGVGKVDFQVYSYFYGKLDGIAGPSRVLV